MDLSLRTETWGQGADSWLGSSHGTSSGRSATLDFSAFTEADHYPDGYFPSGIPLMRDDASGLYVPYAEAGEAEPVTVLAGFLLTSVGVPHDGATDVVGALLDHGRVIVDQLPVEFTPPAADGNATTIVFA